MSITATKKKILVIEDNPDIANLVMVNLRGKNMQAEHAADGKTGLEMALSGDYHLVILDLMLPGIDGMDVCRLMRSEKNYTPVLMLTAKTSELDRVLGLEAGADDYLIKPFSVPELVARVNAIFRRSEQYRSDAVSDESEKLQFGHLCVDPDKRQVLLGDSSVELTAKEFDLLWVLARHPRQVFSRDQLLDLVWGLTEYIDPSTVTVHVRRLREKIEVDPGTPHYIQTVWGVGYRFEP